VITLPPGNGVEQRLAHPVERLRDVDLPVAAERLPGVPVQWSRERTRPGDEHEGLRPVLVEQHPRDDGVGGVGDDGAERRSERLVHVVQGLAVAGDAHHRHPRSDQRLRDRPAEAPARAGHQGGRTPPVCLRVVVLGSVTAVLLRRAAG
jgi:hypothetical protein